MQDVVSNSILSSSSVKTKATDTQSASSRQTKGRTGGKGKGAENLYSTKTSEQRKRLIQKYKENQHWSKEMIEQIAEELGLSFL